MSEGKVGIPGCVWAPMYDAYSPTTIEQNFDSGAKCNCGRWCCSSYVNIEPNIVIYKKKKI